MYLFIAVLLVIEQINFNRYNENLIGMTDEKLIETNIIKKILSLHNLFTDNFLNIFDNTIRLCYLQIAYLLSFNKNGQTFILNIDFIKMFEKLLLQDISKTVQKCKKMEVIARLKIPMGYISIQAQYYLTNLQNG